MNAYHRDVTEFLRGYGAHDIAIIPGGKHPKISFVFRDKKIETPITSSGAEPNAAHSAIRQLRGLLGEPDVPAAAPKRSLDDMTPPPGEAPLPFIGQMALYLDKHRIDQRRLRFLVPAIVVEHFRDKGPIHIARLAHDTWRFRIDPKSRAQFHREGAKTAGWILTAKYDLALSVGFDPFGRSPAEYRIMPDGTVHVRLLTDQIQNLNKRAVRLTAAVDHAAPGVIPDLGNGLSTPGYAVASPVTPGAPSGPIEELDDFSMPAMRMILSLIATIERRTPYRLVRLKETGGMAWQAPLIRLDESNQ